MSECGHFRRIQRGPSAVDVRFYPVSAEPGRGQERSVSPAPVIQTPKLARSMRYELADFQWAAIKPMPPNKAP
jgi:hypothetical protein